MRLLDLGEDTARLRTGYSVYDVTTVPAGTYRLELDTGTWFAEQGVEAFYPLVSITFRIGADPAVHWHIPVLLSPFAYSTYRGS